MTTSFARKIFMANKTKYDTILWARKVLSISEEATFADVKKSFNTLIFKYHPDKDSTANKTDKAVEVITAYKILRSFCQEYKISFSKDSVRKYRSVEEIYIDKFGNDSTWGKG